MPTHHEGRPDEVRALDVFIKLVRAADSVAARVNAHLQDHGLTVSQFGVLEALHHLGAMTASTLGAKILKSGANMTTVLDNLERRGLAVRVRRSDDRRCVEVRLTDEGRALVAGILPAHIDRVVEAMGALSAGEQEQLGALCKAVGRAGVRATKPESS